MVVLTSIGQMKNAFQQGISNLVEFSKTATAFAKVSIALTIIASACTDKVLSLCSALCRTLAAVPAMSTSSRNLKIRACRLVMPSK